MKININLLALSLFWWCPVYLDVDTGTTYNIALHATIIEKLKNKLELPRYSQAIIYQRYIEMAVRKSHVEAMDLLRKYPRFDLIPNQASDIVRDFLHEAHILCDSIDDPSLPDFGEYLNQSMIQFAKDWCSKEGFEWYEE